MVYPTARAREALDQLLRHVGAPRGYLYGVRDGTHRLLAPLHGEPPPGDVEAWVRAEIVSSTNVTTALRTSDSDSTDAHSSPRTRRQLYPLSVSEFGRERLAGAVVIEVDGHTWRQPNAELLRVIARALAL